MTRRVTEGKDHARGALILEYPHIVGQISSSTQEALDFFEMCGKYDPKVHLLPNFDQPLKFIAFRIGEEFIYEEAPYTAESSRCVRMSTLRDSGKYILFKDLGDCLSKSHMAYVHFGAYNINPNYVEKTLDEVLKKTETTEANIDIKIIDFLMNTQVDELILYRPKILLAKLLPQP